jgi:lipid-A-disaccharide synthase
VSGPIYLVAAEPSGDALAADLVAALKSRDETLTFAGIGGAALAAQGVQSPFDIRDLAVLGFVEGLKAYRRVVRRADEAAAAIVGARPQAVVLVDSWGFTLRVAQRVRRAAPTIPLIKYIGPQVWATRPGRAKTLAGAVDHLICIHDFEAPFYKPFGLDCTVCGHPAIGRHVQGDGAGFRQRHEIEPDRPLLLVLPGSRESELRRVGPVLFAAAEQIWDASPHVVVGAVVAAGMESAVDALIANANYPVVRIGPGERDDAFAAATAAIAASGTVTTELALQGAPVVVGYKLGWITWALARGLLLKTRYVTLLNVAANAEIAPEFIQTKFTSDRLAEKARILIEDPKVRAAQVEAQFRALDSMGRHATPAAEIAAGAVLGVIEKSQRRSSGT